MRALREKNHGDVSERLTTSSHRYSRKRRRKRKAKATEIGFNMGWADSHRERQHKQAPTRRIEESAKYLLQASPGQRARDQTFIEGPSAASDFDLVNTLELSSAYKFSGLTSAQKSRRVYRNWSF